jgi:hypothetical protein
MTDQTSKAIENKSTDNNTKDVDKKATFTVEDMAERCCKAWKVEKRADRPCLYFHGLLSKDECKELLQGVCKKHEIKARSTEVGERSEFKHDDEKLSKLLWDRIRSQLPEKLDGGTAIGLRTEWHHARYFPGQSVFAHMDQRQTSQEHRKDPTVASRITLNCYLDRDYTGGEFDFVFGVRDDGSWEKTHLQIAPKTGDAVLFYQAVPEFSHAVPAMKTGTKTILRSDVMYRFASEKEADVGGLNVMGGLKRVPSLGATTSPRNAKTMM